MNDPLLQLKYDALTRQLERMRAMQYGYFTKFFTGLLGSGAVFLFLALYPSPYAQMSLPFLVLTVGVLSSFYLHFVDFARIHASAVEKRINALLGEEILVGGRIEDLYYYPLGQPKISGIALTKPASFFSAFTIHWLFVWTFFFLLGTLSACRELGVWVIPYLAALGLWTVINSAYLAWYFIYQKDEKRIASLLSAVYQQD